MTMNYLTSLMEAVSDADKILIAIGDLFQIDWGGLDQCAKYKVSTWRAPERSDLFPFLQYCYLKEDAQKEELKRAYSNLRKMIDGKDYFIVDLAIDDVIDEAELDLSKCVLPCGGFRYLQCDQDCENKLFVPDDEFLESVRSFYNGLLDADSVEPAKCPVCGADFVFNQVGVTKYNEKGYLNQWKVYTDWLQTTVNKKLCVIELGVSPGFQTMIRDPFEKMIFYNQKSHFYRIHPTFCQVTEELAERSTAIQCNPIDFMLQFNELLGE